MMDVGLLLLGLLWSAGVEGAQNSSALGEDEVRLVGGGGRCSGTVEVKHQSVWMPAYVSHWNLKLAAVFCQRLDCGSPIHAEERDESLDRPLWWIDSIRLQAGAAFRDCGRLENFSYSLKLNCSESVRLLNGSSLCSGRLEVKTSPSHQSSQSDQSDPRWSSMCEADFDLQDAKVVCGELGCGAPSLLQGALYGEAELGTWSPQFQCGGHESSLLDCTSSGSTRGSCSPGRAAGLTCSEPVRLVGGSKLCAGVVEVRSSGEWRPAYVSTWNLQVGSAFCQRLGCGAARLADRSIHSLDRPVWRVRTDLLQSDADLRETAIHRTASTLLILTCTGSAASL